VTAPSPLSAAVRARCSALVAQLPHALDDAVRRATTPDPTTTAAWGADPAITLTCGGPTGNPQDEPFTVDGMRWAVHDVGAGHSWTTRDRTPAVTVTLPDRIENQAELVGALVGLLRR
jgi:hypothetical protein